MPGANMPSHNTRLGVGVMTILNIASNEFSRLAADLLRRGHHVRFRAAGRSMSPSICPGDVLTVVPASDTELRTGDIVFYQRSGGGTAAHRVIRAAGQGSDRLLHVAGDALADPHEPVGIRRVLGRAIRVERGDSVYALDRRGRNLATVWQLRCRHAARRLLHAAKRRGFLSFAPRFHLQMR